MTLTRWFVAAFKKRKVVVRLGNWIATPQQLRMGLPPGAVIGSAFTQGLADLNNNGLSRVLTLADDRLI